ncbi:MAG: sigma-70 family RNA polymerase sigma factor [Limisphaerales bacterium]
MQARIHTPEDEQDEQLMERLISGEDKALDIIIDKYGKEIFNLHLRYTNNYEDADDLAQETFVRLYFNKNKFSKKYRFKTWLYTIAMNLARNHYRWKKRHLNISIDADPEEEDEWVPGIAISTKTDPLKESINRELGNAIDEAMNLLPEDQREAIVLCECRICRSLKPPRS